LKKASSVGLLFEMNEDQDYHAVHEYLTELQELKIKVKALGLIKEKHLALHFLPVLSFDFIYPKDLNWYGKPTSKKAQEFWSTDFDICVNIARPHCFPLKYITSRSVSSLKVGPYADKDKDYYDIMVRQEERNEQSKFLRQIDNYLTILYPKNDA
jgi:hypothetical protein